MSSAAKPEKQAHPIPRALVRGIVVGSRPLAKVAATSTKAQTPKRTGDLPVRPATRET